MTDDWLKVSYWIEEIKEYQQLIHLAEEFFRSGSQLRKEDKVRIKLILQSYLSMTDMALDEIQGVIRGQK